MGYPRTYPGRGKTTLAHLTQCDHPLEEEGVEDIVAAPTPAVARAGDQGPTERFPNKRRSKAHHRRKTGASLIHYTKVPNRTT